MNYIKTVNGYAIYQLSQKECRRHKREYPWYVCWVDDPYYNLVGDMQYTYNETDILEEMILWCEA